MRVRAGAWLKALPALLLVAAGKPAPKPIDLPGARAFPESIDALPDGTAFVGSVAGGVLKVSLKTGKITPWVKPGGHGTASIFGVLADPVNKLLWTCSNDLSFVGLILPDADKGTHLKAFDLATGAGKLSFPLPDGSFCNDMAVAKDGTLYVAETNRSHILRWRPGETSLTDWFSDPLLGDAKGNGLDGIALGSDGQLYVNNFRTHAFVRVLIRPDGAPGGAMAIATSRLLAVPDGLRHIGGMRFAQAEGSGKVALLTVSGDKAEVVDLVSGLSSPTGVAVVGRTVWYAQGEVSYVFSPALKDKTPPLPFRLTPVALPDGS